MKEDNTPHSAHIVQLSNPDLPVKNDWEELMNSDMYKPNPDEEDIMNDYVFMDKDKLVLEYNRLKLENAELKKALFGHNVSLNNY